VTRYDKFNLKFLFLLKYNNKNALLPLKQPTINIFGHTESTFLTKKGNIEIVICHVKSALVAIFGVANVSRPSLVQNNVQREMSVKLKFSSRSVKLNPI
jgi:hypothetical protein